MNAPFSTKRTVLAGLVAAVATVGLAFAAVGIAQDESVEASGAGPHLAVPVLPFDDNPDPDQCGIPRPLGDDVRGTVDGRWEGETLFADVHLYESHLRSRVTGTIPTGTRVRVEMVQRNPVLNFWYVRWDGPGGTVEGWIPAPFLTVER